MEEYTDSLARAREAYATRDWAAAAACFGAVPVEELTADDLAAHADAVWWLGRVHDNLRLGAAACAAYLAASRPGDAGASALMLGILHLARGDEPQGTGWVGRATQLLEEAPEGNAHGLLQHLSEVEPALRSGRSADAVEAARRVQSLGRRLGSPDVVALGLNGEGRALIRSGNVVDGLRLLDTAMTAVVDGEIAPFMSGTLYCHTIAACHEVGDVRRMSRWTDLAERWLAGLPAAVAFGSLCAVHRAQLQVVHGRLADAERTVLEVVADLDDQRKDYAAEAWYVVAEARRLRGDHRAAGAYDEAHARGRDPQPGRALLQLQAGDAAGAATSVRTALTAVGSDPLRRAPLCAAAVEIAVAAGRVAEAATAASELKATADRYATSGLEAMAAGARGTVLLAEGRAAQALPMLRDACSRWHDLDAPREIAATCARLADAYRALGDETSAAAEGRRAEEATARLLTSTPDEVAQDGLSRRELEVLTLVAEGRSNREIADRLFISDRTVGRHLTNIYNKLGVTSRTQAARYALDHGMTATR